MLTALTVVLTLAYPFVIWCARDHLEPRWLALLLLSLIATRIPLLKVSRLAQASVLVGLMMVLGAVWSNALLPLMLYPVLVNLAFLLVFALSLHSPPSMIERFARMADPNLPEEAVAYTRNVTKVWCAFFVLNGSIALGTAIWASHEVWALYTGLIAYILMGTLFAVEFLCRIWFKRRLQSKLG